jgi:hypothetical protein
MWRVLSVSSCSCSIFSLCFGSVLFIVRFSPYLFPLGMMIRLGLCCAGPWFDGGVPRRVGGVA